MGAVIRGEAASAQPSGGGECSPPSSPPLPQQLNRAGDEGLSFRRDNRARRPPICPDFKPPRHQRFTPEQAEAPGDPSKKHRGLQQRAG